MQSQSAGALPSMDPAPRVSRNSSVVDLGNATYKIRVAVWSAACPLKEARQSGLSDQPPLPTLNMSNQFNDDKVEITELDQAKQQSDQYDSPNSPYALALALTVEEREIMEKRLKRKLDFRLLFVLFIIFIMNYLDRNNIAASKVAGLSKTLHLTSTQYSTCVSLLFLGYVDDSRS